MRTFLIAASLALLALAAPLPAAAYVVVRAGVYVRPMPVVVVAPAPVYYAPPPVVYVAPQPVAAPAPQPAPAVLTTKLPVNTTMWTLPAGCSRVGSGDQTFYVCGPNWLKAYPGANGTSYYGVVAPP